MIIVQSEFQGIPEVPYIFRSKKKAYAAYIDIVNRASNRNFKSFKSAIKWMSNNWGDMGVRIWETTFCD